MIWGAAFILALICFGILLHPVLRPSQTKQLVHGETALEIYKDQLAEIDRDLARGLIAESDAAVARLEIQRRILAMGKGVQKRPFSPTSNRIIMIIAALFVPIVGVGVYSITGSPDAQSMPYASRSEEVAQAREINDLAQRLREKLTNHADEGPSEGWMLLGQTYMGMARYNDAAEAFRVVAEREGADSVVFSRYGEALIAAENGNITPLAETQLDRALELDARNPAPSYYKALAFQQRADLQSAYQILADRVALDQTWQPWMESFAQLANDIGAQIDRPALTLPERPAGPSAADMQAAQDMDADERAAFIQSMVTGLAERLAQDPNDLDGWLRLARAYQVLGETAKAKEAFQSAKPLADKLGNDDPRKEIVAQGLAQN
ncbi:c-type cytochrome biogenesis protein CcmI [Amylibacter kogurei]|uniref:C-type cytochrome biogenesis protein CcmI n=1 Tax=Paramylibacter kogurei TaxID=1889778 RepID=A0A2G5K3L8_9RHOB|nr:c-type cytochrome biogenesis protein CcmI [Amylibacter kogurei]PIB23995.1 c-type cytochrome biogenesis protein CcmI [Amylibacter kogurei]